MKSISSKLLTPVHAALIQRFNQPERFALVALYRLLDASSQLDLQIVIDHAESVNARLVVRYNCVPDEAAAGELVKVVARIDIRIHVSENRRSCEI